MFLRIIQQLIVFLSMISPALSSSVLPENIQSCYPDSNWEGYFETSKFIASVRDKGKEYFLFHLYQFETDAPDLLVISTPVSEKKCTQELLNITGDLVSLSQELGEDIGKKFALSIYQQEIQDIGKAALLQKVNKLVRNNYSFFEEDIWAFKQLGIELSR